MNIQEHLAVFDGWLTSRIAEAHAAGKDLAFRDRADAIRLGEINWEYNLLVPGQRAPKGDGWSVYRLHGAQTEHAQTKHSRIDDAQDRKGRGKGAKRRLLGVLSDTLFGADER